MTLVVGVHVLEPAIPELLFHRAPGEVEPCLIEERGLAVRTGCDDHHRGRVGESSELPLALPQCGFDALALPQRTGEPKRYTQREGQTRAGPGYPLTAPFFLDPLIGCPGI